MKKIVWFVFVFFCLPAIVSGNASFTGVVVKVIDGDTCDILCEGATTTRVRLAEIDCPEKGGQPYGQKAKEFVIKNAAQKRVRVDVRTIDRYGRTVGEIFLPDGTSLNRLLVEEGYAWWYRKYSSDSSLGQLELDARLKRRGLWADKDPVAPWDWRKKKR